MIKTTRTWTRKSLDTAWWTSIITKEYRAYVKDKYEVTAKRVGAKLYVSKDGLKLTSETLFSSMETLEEFSKDSIIRSWVKTRKDYCTRNNIDESESLITKE
jgi:hypothetical protein